MANWSKLYGTALTALATALGASWGIEGLTPTALAAGISLAIGAAGAAYWLATPTIHGALPSKKTT